VPRWRDRIIIVRERGVGRCLGEHQLFVVVDKSIPPIGRFCDGAAEAAAMITVRGSLLSAAIEAAEPFSLRETTDTVCELATPVASEQWSS
jgi:hypothetical protein